MSTFQITVDEARGYSQYFKPSVSKINCSQPSYELINWDFLIIFRIITNYNRKIIICSWT